MKKLTNILLIAFMILTSFGLIACGEDNSQPQTVEEYYEIEYQDGTGVHTAKAIKTLLVEDIKIYTPQLTDNVLDYVKWEHNDELYFYFCKEVDNAVGGFITASSQQAFGYVSLYYGEDLQEKHYEWWSGGYYYLKPAEIGMGASFNVESKNITINGQNITHFSISAFLSNDAEFRVSAMTGYTIVKTENIRIGIKIAYPASAIWQKITLVENGDFTSIMRNDISIATIRTENILRKVSNDR